MKRYLDRDPLPSLPTAQGLGPTRHASRPRVEEAKPPRAVHATVQRLQRPSTFAQTSGSKGGQPCRRHATAPSGCTSPTSSAPSMEAQAHASCNRCAGCYVRATAPPLAPLPRLLDCGTITMNFKIFFSISLACTMIYSFCRKKYFSMQTY